MALGGVILNKSKAIRLSIFLIILSCATAAVFGWQRAYNTDFDSRSYVVLGNPDGTFITAGSYFSNGSRSLTQMMKVDAAGNIIWSKNYMLGDLHSEAFSVSRAIDGGYILCGWVRNTGDSFSDAILLKTDSDGNEQWHKTHINTGLDEAISILALTSGEFVFSGKTAGVSGYQNPSVTKTDSSGNIIWRTIFQDPACSYFYSCHQTNDGGFIMGGFKNGMFVAKVDADGDCVWAKTYGPDLSSNICGIIQTTDGGYLIGASGLYNLIKVDAVGNCVWAKKYVEVHSTISQQDRLFLQTTDGGYAMTLGSFYFSGDWDYSLIKTDVNGNLSWSRYFDNAGSSDFPSSLQQTMDGGFIMTGITNSGLVIETLLVKTDSNGFDPDLYTPTVTCTSSVTPTNTVTLTATESSTITITSTATPTFTNTLTATVTMTATITPTYTPTREPLKLRCEGAFPNPAEDKTNFVFKLSCEADVKVHIYTVSGEIINTLSGTYSKGYNSIEWLLRNKGGGMLASGIYIYKIHAVSVKGERLETVGKLCVVK